VRDETLKPESPCGFTEKRRGYGADKGWAQLHGRPESLQERRRARPVEIGQSRLHRRDPPRGQQGHHTGQARRSTGTCRDHASGHAFTGVRRSAGRRPTTQQFHQGAIGVELRLVTPAASRGASLAVH
jgi:hypothetical protein